VSIKKEVSDPDVSFKKQSKTNNKTSIANGSEDRVESYWTFLMSGFLAASHPVLSRHQE
jgi:hypothetical protein